jgi:Flp pilus assembly protein TadG
MLKSIIRNQKGSTLVEFAVATPIAFVLCFAAGDFGRMFTESAILAGAANAGAIYGYRNVGYASDSSGIQSAILTDAAQLSGVSASSSQVCDCPDAPGAWISCNDTTCSNGYDKPRAYIRARATKSFETLGVYPNIPSQVAIDMSAYMRIQ